MCILMTSLTFVALGQEFEAVVIKPNKSGSNSSSSHGSKSQLLTTNVSLRSLIVRAYGMKDYQVEGPEWLNDARFDVAAKYPTGLPEDPVRYNAAMQAMMQKLLVDQFKLEVHRETKNLPVYGLVVAKGGIKFKEVPDAGSHGSNNENGHYVGTCIPMSNFADFLARRMDMPVLDMTGLKGFYNLTLDFVEARRAADSKPDATAPDPGATLDTAIQEQLGLKLDNRKAPLEIVVVDHAEKTPIEN